MIPLNLKIVILYQSEMMPAMFTPSDWLDWKLAELPRSKFRLRKISITPTATVTTYHNWFVESGL